MIISFAAQNFKTKVDKLNILLSNYRQKPSHILLIKRRVLSSWDLEFCAAKLIINTLFYVMSFWSHYFDVIEGVFGPLTSENAHKCNFNIATKKHKTKKKEQIKK